jgi:hypothetical protein
VMWFVSRLDELNSRRRTALVFGSSVLTLSATLDIALGPRDPLGALRPPPREYAASLRPLLLLLPLFGGLGPLPWSSGRCTPRVLFSSVVALLCVCVSMRSERMRANAKSVCDCVTPFGVVCFAGFCIGLR